MPRAILCKLCKHCNTILPTQSVAIAVRRCLLVNRYYYIILNFKLDVGVSSGSVTMFVDDLLKGFYDVVSNNVSRSIVNHSYSLEHDHDLRYTLNRAYVSTRKYGNTMRARSYCFIIFFWGGKHATPLFALKRQIKGILIWFSIYIGIRTTQGQIKVFSAHLVQKKKKMTTCCRPM